MQKKNGISLIVLVITIIVMIVLAGAIILSLNNAGIIGKANQAVKDTDVATAKELAQMAWAEAYVDGVKKVEDEGTNKGFRTRVTEALNANEIDTTKYLLNVTTKGVTVKLLENAWIKKGLTVVKGNQVLEIGKTINYDDGVSSYTGGWKVLGADDDGNLLIISDTYVKTNHRFGYETTDITMQEKMEECYNDWLNGAEELDGICAAYGTGKGAIGARSIRVEDINDVTGYNPKTSGYQKGQPSQYKNTVTYKYNGTINPDYVGKNGATGTLETPHDNGYWYDGKCVADLTTRTIGETFAVLTSNYYYYYPTSLTTNSSDEIKGLTVDSDIYKMLFGTSDNYSVYWLASPYINPNAKYTAFGMRIIGGGYVGPGNLWKSQGEFNYYYTGVRAVVTIASDFAIN